MESKTHTLRFRIINRDIFDAIKKGKKKVETRAATEKYKSIEAGDTLRLVCGKSEFKKKIRRVKKFKSVKAMLKEYRPKDINPRTQTAAELEKIYANFPKYKQKLKKYGLVAMEL